MEYYKDDYTLIKNGKFYNLLYKGELVWTGYKTNDEVAEERFMEFLIKDMSNYKEITKLQVPKDLNYGDKVEILCPICKNKLIIDWVAKKHYYIYCKNKCLRIIR